MCGKLVQSPLESNGGVEHWLASWKATCLSVGGRVMPIQAVLFNLPVYYMSLFKCLMSMVNRLKKLRRDFLWQGKESKKRFHFVDWKSICKPKKSGGLGIRPLVHMNRALLGKWLSRLGEGYSLWVNVVAAKYDVSRGGWKPGGSAYRFSEVRRGIMPVKESFNANIKIRVGDGRKMFSMRINGLAILLCGSIP